MARKPVTDGGKREKIVVAAMKFFLEKGYDGTSIRAIMKKAGGEVGLFYYYFNNKDDVFDKALDLFFASYQNSFAEITDSAYRDPFRALTRFFEYMKAETVRFRDKYAANIHRTVRWAIRERTLTIVTPYIRQIIGVLAELGATPPLNLDVAAVMLAHGVGSMILHEDSEWVEQITAEVQKAVHLIMGLEPEYAELMFPVSPMQKDISSLVKLAEGMKQYFPGFEQSEFETQLKAKAENHEVLAIRNRENAVGCIAFSHEKNEIDFLAVDPEYRRSGIASRLLITAMSEFSAGTEVSVVTYREGDSLGTEARRFYQKSGFHDGELLTAFGYPCQRLIGKVPSSVLKVN